MHSATHCPQRNATSAGTIAHSYIYTNARTHIQWGMGHGAWGNGRGHYTHTRAAWTCLWDMMGTRTHIHTHASARTYTLGMDMDKGHVAWGMGHKVFLFYVFGVPCARPVFHLNSELSPSTIKQQTSRSPEGLSWLSGYFEYMNSKPKRHSRHS